MQQMSSKSFMGTRHWDEAKEEAQIDPALWSSQLCEGHMALPQVSSDSEGQDAIKGEIILESLIRGRLPGK